MSKSTTKWQKPTAVLKLKKKRRSSHVGGQLNLSSADAVKSRGSSSDSKSTAVKRRNPFRQNSNCKRQHLSGATGHDALADSQLFSVLSKLESDSIANREEVEKQVINSSNLSDVLKKPVNIKSEEDSEDQTADVSQSLEGSFVPPPDWSLKTKVRFVSSKPFTWCHPLRSTEVAAGVTSIVRCSQCRDFSNLENAKIEFHRTCHYWVHPDIPWLKLFPRIAPDYRIGKMTALNTDEDVKKSLMQSWSESFKSLFHLLRTGYCPYFYVCTHQFTALFRATGIAGNPQIHALLTPTTRGFREGLGNEGIEFKMPLKRKTGALETSLDDESPDGNMTAENEQKNEEQNCDPTKSIAKPHDDHDDADNDVDEDDDDLAATNEGASSWLQSMGLDKAKFPSLNPDKVKIQREGYKVIDNRPESLVYVEEAETQALFNYLLNCRTCVSITGPQSGIPPTLLSPVAFKGATLQSLKINQTSIRQQMADGSLDRSFVMDAVGPILPHMFFSLSKILKATQDGDFKAVLSVHEQTTPFNVGSNNSSSEADCDSDRNDTNSFGLDQDVMEYLRSKCSFVKTGMREILCRDNLLTWSS